MHHRKPISTVWLLALFLGGVSAPAIACATQEGCLVDKVREQFLASDKGLARAGAENSCPECDDIDFEKSACINGYGLDMSSFSLSGLASGLMDKLKNAVCSAADNYVGSQIAGIGMQIEAPMGIGGLGVGFDKGGSGFNFDHDAEELDFNFDAMVREQSRRLPTLGTGYFDGDYTGGSSFDDFRHVDQRQR